MVERVAFTGAVTTMAIVLCFFATCVEFMGTTLCTAPPLERQFVAWDSMENISPPGGVMCCVGIGSL